ENLRRGWRIVMAGGYVAYYYNNTAWDIVKPDPEAPGNARFRIMKQVMESVPYWRMDPVPSLAAGGMCIADPAGTWMCYVEGSKQRRKENTITLNLTGSGGPASVEWINTWSGERKTGGEVNGGIAVLEYPESFEKAPAVVVIRRK
ncbi:MAG TPA: hypothetical protein VES20_14370, partial [Bryobacteraceae bacterium]|nr:hypothetical protein [Bryobacteraceae bacterium]